MLTVSRTFSCYSTRCNRHVRLLCDDEAVAGLAAQVDELMSDPEQMDRLGENIKKMGKPDAALEIVKQLETLIK